MKVTTSKGKRIIILHARSEDGFMHTALLLASRNIKDSCFDYHSDICAEIFEEWFIHTLLKNIPARSVIVIDNAGYHSKKKIQFETPPVGEKR